MPQRRPLTAIPIVAHGVLARTAPPHGGSRCATFDNAPHQCRGTTPTIRTDHDEASRLEKVPLGDRSAGVELDHIIDTTLPEQRRLRGTVPTMTRDRPAASSLNVRTGAANPVG